MRSMRWALTGVVLVLASCGGGSSSSNSEVSSTTSEESPTSTVAGTEVVYKVGDTGPGGGIIVYVDIAGFDNSSADDKSIGAMCMTGTCHYLEMAPSDLSAKYSRAEAIVAAEAFSTATANDWLLPSLDALNEMCKYAFSDTVNVICNDNGVGGLLNSVGGLSPVDYLSSSENAYAYAWFQYFFDGSQAFGASKDNASTVRPVRAF